MIQPTRHLSDAALLLVIDHELSPRRLMRARKHLAGCQTCRARLARIETTVAAVFALPWTDVDRPLPPAAPARARLARRMAEGGARPAQSIRFFVVPNWVPDRRWLWGAAVFVLALASGLIFSGQRHPAMTVPSGGDGVFLLPRADLTPGATAQVTLHDICGPGRHGRAQPIPATVHETIFTRYGANYGQAAEYELDYLVTPELGGVPDARNLWPQPFARTPWNAYVKDELEQLFHRLVCDGKIELATAQREIASDWISAYKRYFNTNAPLRDYEVAPPTALDRDLILSELEELGLSAPAWGSEGSALMMMLQRAREQSHPERPQVAVEFAVFRLRP